MKGFWLAFLMLCSTSIEAVDFGRQHSFESNSFEKPKCSEELTQIESSISTAANRHAFVIQNTNSQNTNIQETASQHFTVNSAPTFSPDKSADDKTIPHNQISDTFSSQIQGSFYGILITLLIYHLVLFFSSRDKEHGYLGISIILLSAHHLLSFDALAWREYHGTWLTMTTTSLTLANGIIWLALTKLLFPKMISRQILQSIQIGFALVAILAAGLFFLSPTIGQFIAASFQLTALGTCFYFSTQSWRRNNNNKKILYVLTALPCLLVGSSLLLFIPDTPRHNNLVVVTFELLTISALLAMTIALGIRFHQLKLVNNSLTHITRQILQENKQNFETQLAKRTRSLTKNQLHLNSEINDKTLALEKTLDQLKLSNQLKDDFLSKVSHEFKTPLNGIQGTLQLTNETHLDKEQRSYITSALASSKKLSQLIDDVLDLSQLNAGLIKLKKEPFDLRNAFSTTCDSYRSTANQKGLQFEFGFSTDFPHLVKGDEYRFTQILEKLISNAVKFTSSGNITITGEVLETYGDCAALLLRVSDTGIGIPQDMQEGIFESFRQVERFFSRKYEGTGIGLAFSFLLVKQMGGNISVKSSPGRGSTFQFTLNLPVIEKKNPEQTTVLREVKNDNRQRHQLKGRILVIEDNHVNQMVMLGFLKKIGLYADIADNGKIGLQMLNIKHYDLILMDCQMPVMNGFEATIAIREAEGNGPHIPIIAVTANSLMTDQEACIQAGMSGYIAKPVNANLLYHKLSEWLLPQHTQQNVAKNGSHSSHSFGNQSGARPSQV